MTKSNILSKSKTAKMTFCKIKNVNKIFVWPTVDKE